MFIVVSYLKFRSNWTIFLYQWSNWKIATSSAAVVVGQMTCWIVQSWECFFLRMYFLCASIYLQLPFSLMTQMELKSLTGAIDNPAKILYPYLVWYYWCMLINWILIISIAFHLVGVFSISYSLFYCFPLVLGLQLPLDKLAL